MDTYTLARRYRAAIVSDDRHYPMVAPLFLAHHDDLDLPRTPFHRCVWQALNEAAHDIGPDLAWAYMIDWARERAEIGEEDGQ